MTPTSFDEVHPREGAGSLGAGQRLIELRHPDGGPGYTDVGVAAGAGISPQYARNLKNGNSVSGPAPAMRWAAFFCLANVDYFVMHGSHAPVTAVEQRPAELERAHATARNLRPDLAPDRNALVLVSRSVQSEQVAYSERRTSALESPVNGSLDV